MTSKGRYSSCAVYNTYTCQPPGGGRWRLLSPDAGHEPSLGPLPRLLARRRLRGRLPRRRFRFALPKAKLAEVLPGHQVRVHATLQVPLGEPLALQGVTLLPLEASEIVRGELKATRGEREGTDRQNLCGAGKRRSGLAHRLTLAKVVEREHSLFWSLRGNAAGPTEGRGHPRRRPLDLSPTTPECLKTQVGVASRGSGNGNVHFAETETVTWATSWGSRKLTSLVSRGVEAGKVRTDFYASRWRGTAPSKTTDPEKARASPGGSLPFPLPSPLPFSCARRFQRSVVFLSGGP